MSQGSKIRWSKDQILLFLNLILEACRDGKMNSSKSIYLRQGFATMVEPLKMQYPSRPWNLKMLENKYYYLKKFWRVFCEAEKTSGTTYDEESGALSLSHQNQQLLISRYSHFGRKVVASGLLVGDGITIDSWQEIFAKDQPAGQHIREAGDADGWAHSEGNRGLEDHQISEEVEEEEEGLSEVAREDVRPYGPFDSDDDEAIIATQLQSPLPPPLSPTLSPRTSITSGRGSSTPSSFNEAIIGSRKKKARRLQEKRGIASSEAIQQLAAALISRDSQPREHVVIHKQLPVGAEAFEIAVKECFEFFDDRGMDFSIKLVRWMREDPMNPLTWNSLPSRKAKEAWVAANFD